MRYDPDAQAAYEELERRGYFKDKPDARAAAEELARRGVLQVGLYPSKRGKETPAPAPSRRSSFLLETPEESTADLLGRSPTTPLLTATRPTIGLAPSLDTDALPKKVAKRYMEQDAKKRPAVVPGGNRPDAPAPKPKPKKAPVFDPQYELSDERRRAAMVERAKPRPAPLSGPLGRTFAPQDRVTGSLLNPEDAANAYLATPYGMARRNLAGTPLGDLLDAPAVNPEAASVARLYGLSPTDAAVYGAAVQEGEDDLAQENLAFGRAAGENALPGVAALAASRFAGRLLPGPWKLAALPLALGAASLTQGAQGAAQRGGMGDPAYEAYQQQLAEDRAKYPVSTFLAEQLPFMLTSQAANPFTRQGLLSGGVDAATEAGQQVAQNLLAGGKGPGYDPLRIFLSGLTGSAFSGHDTALGRRAFAPVDAAAARAAANPTVGNALLGLDNATLSAGRRLSKWGETRPEQGGLRGAARGLGDALTNAPGYLDENFDFDPSRIPARTEVLPALRRAGQQPTLTPPNLTGFREWEAPAAHRFGGADTTRLNGGDAGGTVGPPLEAQPAAGRVALDRAATSAPPRTAEGPYTRLNIRSYEALSDALQDPHGFGYDKETADGTAAIWESVARSWAERNGKTPQEWYRRYVAGVTGGGEEVARQLLWDMDMDPDKAPDYAGATQGVRKWTNDPADVRQVVSALSSPNASTAVHEFAHVFRKQLGDEAAASDAVRTDLGVLESWAGVQGGKWDGRAEEKFARGYERWLQTGKAPNESLSGVFARFKDWITDVYSRLVEAVGGKPAIDRYPAFNPEVVKMLSRYMGDVSDITGTPSGVRNGRKAGTIEVGVPVNARTSEAKQGDVNDTATLGTRGSAVPIAGTAPAARRRRPNTDVLPVQPTTANAAPTADSLPVGGDGGAGGRAEAAPVLGKTGGSVPESPGRVERVDPSTLEVLPGMQFRGKVNKKGVTDKLRNQRDYDIFQGGVLTVWERSDGKRFIVDGHHRYELAERADRFVAPNAKGGFDEVPRSVEIRVVREADGWTAETAKAWGVRRNLAEGTANPVDAANALLSLNPDTARAEVLRLPRTSLTRDTAGLLNLTNEGRELVANDVVSESVAAGIGDALPGDGKRQAAALAAAAKSGSIKTYEDGLTLGARLRDEELVAQESGQMDMFGDSDFSSSLQSTIAKQTELIAAAKRRLTAEKSSLLATEKTSARSGEVFDVEGRRAEAEAVSGAKSKVDALLEFDPAVKDALRSVASSVVKGEMKEAEAVERLRSVLVERGKAPIAEITARASGQKAKPAEPARSPYAMEGDGKTPDTETPDMFDEPATVTVPEANPSMPATAGEYFTLSRGDSGSKIGKRPIEGKVEPFTHPGFPSEVWIAHKDGDSYLVTHAETGVRAPGIIPQKSAKAAKEGFLAILNDPERGERRVAALPGIIAEGRAKYADILGEKPQLPTLSAIRSVANRDPLPIPTSGPLPDVRAAATRRDDGTKAGETRNQPAKNQQNPQESTPKTDTKTDIDFDLTRPIADVAAAALKRAGVKDPTPEQSAIVEKGVRWGRERIARAESEWEQYRLLDYDRESGNYVIQSPREDANGNKTTYEGNLKNGTSNDPDSLTHLKAINEQLGALSVKERVVSKHTQIARRLVEREYGELPQRADDVLFQVQKFGGRDILTRHDSADVRRRLETRLQVMREEPNRDMTQRQYMGEARDFIADPSLPKKVQQTPIYFVPNYTGAGGYYEPSFSSGKWVGGQIGLTTLGFQGSHAEKDIGNVLLHEVQHALDWSTVNSSSEENPKLRRLLQDLHGGVLDTSRIFRGRAEDAEQEAVRVLGVDAPREKIEALSRLLANETYRYSRERFQGYLSSGIGYDGKPLSEEMREHYKDSLHRLEERRATEIQKWGVAPDDILFQRNRKKDTETLDIFSDASGATPNAVGQTAPADNAVGQTAPADNAADQSRITGGNKVPVRQRDLFVDQGLTGEAPRRGQQTFDDTTHGGLFAATPAPEDAKDDGQETLFSRNRRQATAATTGQQDLPNTTPPKPPSGRMPPGSTWQPAPGQLGQGGTSGRVSPMTSPGRKAVQNALPDVTPEQTRTVRQAVVEAAKTGGAYFLDALSAPKSLLSSVDVSGAGRQGAPLGAAKPDAWVKAWVPMIRSFRGKGYAAAIEKVARHKYAHLAADTGLYLSSRDEAADLITAKNREGAQRLSGYRPPRTREEMPGGRDENFPSQLAARLPWVRASDQAYTAFLDTLRMDVYEKFVDELKAQGKDPKKKEDRKAFMDAARAVNILSGRGELWKLDDPDAGKTAATIKGVLGMGIFSPRFVASKFQFMNPVTYARMDPLARKQMAKGALSWALMYGSAVTLLAATTGAQVSLDPESPDFGKLKYGDFTYDLGAGNLQMLRYLYRVGASTARNLAGKAKGAGDNPVAITGKFIRSKASPVGGYAADLPSGKSYPSGEKFDAGKRALEMLPPLGVQDAYKGYRQEGWAGVAKTLPGAFGVGVQMKERVNPEQSEKQYRETLMRLNERQGKPRTLTPQQERDVAAFRRSLENAKAKTGR